VPSVFAQTELITISKSDLNERGVVDLSNQLWRYHSGDNIIWANPDYDDINWEPAYTKMQSGGMLDTHWSGVGWFRLHVKIDSSLAGTPIGFHMYQNGASEIYLNGRLIKKLGKVSDQKKGEKTKVNVSPFWVPMQVGKPYVIAIRFSNHQYKNFLSSDYFDLANIYKGFHLSIGDFNSMNTHHLALYRNYYFFMLLLLGITLSIFLMHLILYLYYPDQKSNLYYSLTIGCFTTMMFSEIFVNLNHIFRINIVVLLIDLICFILLGPLFLRFTYSLTKKKVPRHFYYLVAIAFLIAVASVFFVLRMRFIASLFILINLIESARILITYFYHHKKGAVIIAVGFLITIILAGNQMLINMGIISRTTFPDAPIFAYYGILGTIVAMSVYLARGIAETNKNLKIKLQEVAHLSEINREKDRKHAEFKLTSEKEKANAREANLRAEAAELKLQVQIAEKKALESEDRRKSEELEEARKLQLSMLPKKLPAVPGLNIAVYMDTATEVGGDYYDFYQKDNDELTLAIGDATGHGLKASTLVTAVKSLFPNLAQEDEIPSIFRAYTQTIKGMNLGILYMALTIAKFKAIETDNNANTKPLFTIDISSSGMPPVFLFRAAEKQTDSIILKGMPLGSVTNFPYQQKKYELFPNDVLLFMSDGFVELFDPNKKMIGLTNAKKVFTDVATQSPQEIIDHLTSFAAQWKKDLPAKDDITFVVVKIEAAK